MSLSLFQVVMNGLGIPALQIASIHLKNKKDREKFKFTFSFLKYSPKVKDAFRHDYFGTRVLQMLTEIIHFSHPYLTKR